MCRKFKKPGTHVDYTQRPNLIKQNSSKAIWRTDITYLRLNNGPLVYLSTVFDNQNAQIIAQKINKTMTSQLVTDTLLRALQKNKAPEYLHSDMGSQYTSAQFENLLEQNSIQHSYSLKGHPYDNGPMEAFHSILKREFAFQVHFSNYEELILKTEKYIDFYNHKRIIIFV